MAKKTTDNGASAPVRLTSLADMPSLDIDVHISTGNEALVIPCRELTYKRFQEIGRMVTEPEPKTVGAGPKGPIYSYSHPEYLQARQDAADRRLYLRLAEFVKLDIPGETLEARAAQLEDALSVAIVTKLAEAMQKTQSEGETRIEQRAVTFLDV